MEWSRSFKKMKRILIIHPEGNITNNPNLTGIVECLSDQGYYVDILSIKRSNVLQKISQVKNCKIIVCKGKRPRILNRFSFLNINLRLLAGIGYFFDFLSLSKFTKYNLIIGVDDGVIGASIISSKLKIPYGLISYEIFFKEEMKSLREKEREIKACKNISFAVAQDPLRSELLSIENQIPLNKIIEIPVAGRGVNQLDKNKYLHKKLGIDLDKKIAIYMGSLDEWAMVGKLILDSEKWDDDWVLVLHSRYGLNKKTSQYYKNHSHKNNIFFSDNSVDSFDDLAMLLQSVNLGIAFYTPRYTTKWDGLNIKHIGLSSGKIATYLSNGIPVLINELGLITDLVKQYNAGKIICNNKEIIIDYSYKELNQLRNNCFKLFKDQLDLNIKITPLLKKIEEMIK